MKRLPILVLAGATATCVMVSMIFTAEGTDDERSKYVDTP
jgi:hypothetical protein